MSPAYGKPSAGRSRSKRRWVYAPTPKVGKETDEHLESTKSIDELLKFYEMYLAHLKTGQDRIISTRCSLKNFGIYISAIGVERITDVTPEIIEGYAFYTHTAESNKGGAYSARTIVGRFSELRRFFRWLTARGYILSDPATELENPRVPKTIPRDLPSSEELEKLLSMPDLRKPRGFRDRAMLEVLYATGLRSSEITKLDVESFDFEAKTLSVVQGKPKKDRLVPLLSIVCEVLKGYIEGPRKRLIEKEPDQSALFPGECGKRLGRKTFSANVSNYGKRARIEKPVTPITIRHAIATHLLSEGTGIRHIQALLGHKSIETTTLYTKVTPVDLQTQLRKFHPRQKERRKPRNS